MQLTTAQQNSVLAWIAANMQGQSDDAIANALNALQSAFFVFQSAVPIQTILNNITYANYTPAVAIAADGSNAALWTACSMGCQGKQFELQLLLPPGSTFNAGLVNLRAGLNDATTNVAGGTPLGALVSGGWGGILPILRRQATLLESLFAVVTTGVGTGVGALGATGNPGLLVLEGAITAQNVADIRGGV